LARSYVIFEQQVLRGDQVLCHATAKIACVNEKMKPTALPMHLHKAIASYGNEE